MSLYKDLGLDPSCTNEEIKYQYRILAHKHHPDMGGDEEIFKRISKAYEVLGDPDRRAEYDSTGKTGEDMSVKSEAIQRLGNMVTQFIFNINPEVDDLIAKMKADINQARHRVEGDIVTCNRLIHNLNIIVKKIRMKKQGENILKTFAENQITLREKELITFNRTLEVFALMMDILDNYHYGNDEWTLLLDAINTTSTGTSEN